MQTPAETTDSILINQPHAAETVNTVNAANQIPAVRSRPRHLMPVTLGSESSVMLFKRYFSRADNAFYMSTKVVRLQRREELARKNSSLIDALLEQFLSEIETTAATLDQTYQAARPQNAAPFAYEQNTSFQAACSSHYSVKLLNVYEKLDRLVGLCDALEIIGAITAENAEKLVDSWVRRFRQFSSQVNEIRAQSFPSWQRITTE